MTDRVPAPWHDEMRAHMGEDRRLRTSFFTRPDGSAELSDVVKAYGHLDPDGLPGPDTITTFLPFRVDMTASGSQDAGAASEQIERYGRWLAQNTEGAWMVLLDDKVVYYVFEHIEDATIFTLIGQGT